MRAILVTIRGLQSAALGCYGNDAVATPAFDRLAAGGVVCDAHLADAASADGARRSWRTGRLRWPGCNSVSRDAERSEDLIAALSKLGVTTRLIVDRSKPVPEEFIAGWDSVVEIVPDGDLAPLDGGIEAVRLTLEEWAARDNWLLCLDLGTLLPPWDVPAEALTEFFPNDAAEDEEPLAPLLDPMPGPVDPDDDVLHYRLQTTYSAAVSQLDTALGALLDLLNEQGRGTDTLLIVTSDIGQSLAEHGIVGPVCPWPYEELIHLPLILRLPGTAEAGRRVAALTQAIDLAPTLAESFGLVLTEAAGHSLWPLLRGQVEQVREYAVAALQVGDTIGLCLRTLDWAYLTLLRPHPGEPEREAQLFVKPDDRWEVNDVRQHYVEVAEGFDEQLRKAMGDSAISTV